MPASRARRCHRGVRARPPYCVCVIARPAPTLELSIPYRCILDGGHGPWVSPTPFLRRAVLLLATGSTALSYVHLHCPERVLRARAGFEPNSGRGASRLYSGSNHHSCRVSSYSSILYNPLLAASILTKPVVALTTLLDVLPNFFADLALLCRMLAVYSSPLTSKPRFYAIFGITVVFKVLRVISISLFLVYIGRGPVHAVTFKWTSQERMWSLVDRCVTAVDNAYVRRAGS
jgi:hypothetical protein